MPSSKRTPGPWRSDGEGVEGKAFDGSWRWITERIRGGTPGERIANARLIAAAPELLEALVGAVESSLTDGDCCCYCGRDIHLCEVTPGCPMFTARAAIAKAEGRS